MKETMGDSTKQICRLCIEKSPASELEDIDEIKKEMLEVLLININFNTTNYGVACKRCLSRLQDSFNFKSHCIETAMEGGNKADVEKVFPREMMSSEENICVEDLQVCQLCMSVIQDEDVNEVVVLITGVLLKDAVRNCLPEMDLNDIQESLLCKSCLKGLKEYHEFMKDCRVVERLCEAAHRGTAKMAIAEMLDSQIKTECCDELVKPVIIKEESSAYAEDNINLVMCQKNEDIASIECEELHIKDEGDIGEEMGDSVPLGVCSNSEQSGSLKRKRQTRKSASKGRKYFSSDDYIARRKDKDKLDMEMYKCDNCEFRTRYKHSIIQHMARHRVPKAERKFRCDKCSYETVLKCYLRSHNLIHMDKSDVKMHKCEICEYETRHKCYIKQHMVKHRDPKSEKKFKCDKCPYGTDIKYSIRKHNLIHKDKSEVEIYKCANCEYETRRKDNLRQHMLIHRDPEAERKFKCDKCSYGTDLKAKLRTHNLIHKDKSEVKMHKCEICEFETRHKSNIKTHIVKHHEPRAERKFKCDKCPYETDFTFSLRRHNLIHMDKPEVKNVVNTRH